MPGRARTSRRSSTIREQVLDPMTAYQMTSMLRGRRRSAARRRWSRRSSKPVAGKTGTTNDYRDAWFVGFTPDLVVGLYIGYDKPRPLGRGATGGQLAAPIFLEFMQMALADTPPIPFRVPPGMNFIPIDRKTGLLAQRRGRGHHPRGVQARHRAARHLLDHRLYRRVRPAADGGARFGSRRDLRDRRALLARRVHSPWHRPHSAIIARHVLAPRGT